MIVSNQQNSVDEKSSLTDFSASLNLVRTGKIKLDEDELRAGVGHDGYASGFANDNLQHIN